MADQLPDLSGGSNAVEATPVLVVDSAGKIGASSAPLADYIPTAPSNSALPNGNCRAICVTVAGTVNLTTPAGVDRDGVPCGVGVNAYSASKIRPGGTATGLFAGY